LDGLIVERCEFRTAPLARGGFAVVTPGIDFGPRCHVEFAAGPMMVWHVPCHLRFGGQGMRRVIEPSRYMVVREDAPGRCTVLADLGAGAQSRILVKELKRLCLATVR
jgi:hypothetical protein